MRKNPKGAIKRYFAQCTDQLVYDLEGKMVCDAKGQPKTKRTRLPTLPGLVHALGFCSLGELEQQAARDPTLAASFADARCQLEDEITQLLYTSSTHKGALMLLQYYFGYGREHADTHTPKVVTVRLTEGDGTPDPPD